MSWAEMAEPVVAGLAGVLGVLGTESVLAALRRRGLVPERWDRS